MKYKLTDEDYLRLWAITYPSDIEHQFGKERSRSSRQIYRLYQKFGRSRITENRKEFRARILEKSPTNASAIWINEEVGKLFAKEQKKEFDKTWRKINRFEEQWDAHS